MKKDDVRFVSILSRDSVLDGKRIVTPSDFKIAGRVEQHVECGGKLIVSATGRVGGNLKAKEMVIEGTVTGDVWVQGTLTLRKTASLTGRVSAGNLVVEEGAWCNMSTLVDKKAEDRFSKSAPVAPKNAPELTGEALPPSETSTTSAGETPGQKDNIESDESAEDDEKEPKGSKDRFW